MISEKDNIRELNDRMVVINRKFNGVELEVIQAINNCLDDKFMLWDIEYEIYEARSLQDLGRELVKKKRIFVQDSLKPYFNYEKYALIMY